MLVPDDLAVVGWDDVMTARYMTPGLTTVRQPTRELGRLAVSRLVARLGGDAGADQAHLLASALVLRSSCGCPPACPPAAGRPPAAGAAQPAGQRPRRRR